MKGINHYTAIVDCCDDEISGTVDTGDIDARGEVLKGFIVRDIKKRFPKFAYYIITSPLSEDATLIDGFRREAYYKPF